MQEITDKFINEELYITADEHQQILNHTNAKAYCRAGLLNDIEIHPDAVYAFWQGRPIHCHHRNGKYASVEQLMADDAYFDLDASELIILPAPEHCEVHHSPDNIAEDLILNGRHPNAD